MDIVSAPMTVADYVHAMDRGEIQVNREYQRSDQVWPPAARSYLIETMLLGMPMPKLALHQITDVRTRKVLKEIVDGQQRSRTIHDFFHDKLRLSRTIETSDAAGRLYSQLDEDLQQKFLEYSLAIDLFVGVTSLEIREVFRRMNSYMIPLNSEEQRHARFQGEFKWFVQGFCRDFGALFSDVGIFGSKQLVRMQDTKLIAEIVHAMVHGITTTSKTSLDLLYKEFDKDFGPHDDIGEEMESSFDQLAAWSDLHGTQLMKPFIVYSLVLAIIHARKPLAPVEDLTDLPQRDALDDEITITNLSALTNALDNPAEAGDYGAFVSACTEKTNVKSQRERRFQWMSAALQPELL